MIQKVTAIIFVLFCVMGCKTVQPTPTTEITATEMVQLENEDSETQEVNAQETNNKQITLTFGFEDRLNPPYVLTESEINWEKPGITLEVLQLVADRLDINIEFARMPWARNLEQLEANRLDGVFHASFKAERMELGVYPMKDGEVDPSKRIMTNIYYLYKLKNSAITWDGESFANVDGKIGAVIGFSIVGDLQALGIDVHEVSDQRQSLQMLTRGRLAAVADLGTMTDLYLETYPDEFADVIRVEPPLSNKEYYLILSHQFVAEQPELAEAIWDEIRKIRESGEYNEIAKKYLQ